MTQEPNKSFKLARVHEVEVHLPNDDAQWTLVQQAVYKKCEAFRSAFMWPPQLKLETKSADGTLSSCHMSDSDDWKVHRSRGVLDFYGDLFTTEACCLHDEAGGDETVAVVSPKSLQRRQEEPRTPRQYRTFYQAAQCPRPGPEPPQ